MFRAEDPESKAFSSINGVSPCQRCFRASASSLHLHCSPLRTAQTIPTRTAKQSCRCPHKWDHPFLLVPATSPWSPSMPQLYSQEFGGSRRSTMLSGSEISLRTRSQLPAQEEKDLRLCPASVLACMRSLMGPPLWPITPTRRLGKPTDPCFFFVRGVCNPKVDAVFATA